jgi:hypothetical protein
MGTTMTTRQYIAGITEDADGYTDSSVSICFTSLPGRKFYGCILLSVILSDFRKNGEYIVQPLWSNPLETIFKILKIATMELFMG